MKNKSMNIWRLYWKATGWNPKNTSIISLLKSEKITLNEYNRPNAWAYFSLFFFIFIFLVILFMKHFHVLKVKFHIHSYWMWMENLRTTKWDNAIIFSPSPFQFLLCIGHVTFLFIPMSIWKGVESNWSRSGTLVHLSSSYHLCCHSPGQVKVISTCPTTIILFTGFFASSFISSATYSPHSRE